MKDKDTLDMDALIDDALSSERLRPAPITLQRRVEERVRLIALCDHEQARFRYSMAVLGTALLAVFGGAAFVLCFTSLSDLISHGVSGGKGQLDYWTTSISTAWKGYSGAYSLLTSVLLAGGAVLLGLIPLRKRIWGH